jgi:hypothetical protein
MLSVEKEKSYCKYCKLETINDLPHNSCLEEFDKLSFKRITIIHTNYKRTDNFTSCGDENIFYCANLVDKSGESFIYFESVSIEYFLPEFPKNYSKTKEIQKLRRELKRLEDEL